MKKQIGILILVSALSPFALAGRSQEKFTSAEESFQVAMDKLLHQYIDKGLTKEDLYRARPPGCSSR